MDRGQFTFYASFATALRRLKRKNERCDAYDAIVNYALFGVEPEEGTLPDAVMIAFELIRPNLDASRRKALGGKNGIPKDTGKIAERYEKDSGNKREKENEIETETETETEIENETETEVELEREREREKKPERAGEPSIPLPPSAAGPAAGVFHSGATARRRQGGSRLASGP